jgi:hypothetical protein
MASTRSRTRLKGEAELIKKLRKIPGLLSVVLDAVPEAAIPVARQANANAPIGTEAKHGRAAQWSNLKGSVVVWIRKRTGGFVNVRVGPHEGAPHGLWVEKEHRVMRSRKGRVLGTTTPTPFLAPAWIAEKNRVRGKVRKTFKSLIDQVGRSGS